MTRWRLLCPLALLALLGALPVSSAQTVASCPAGSAATATLPQRFADPSTGDYPQPTLVIGQEQPKSDYEASMDAFRAHGYCTIVIVPLLGPSFNSGKDSIRPQGDYWRQMRSVFDAASERGLRIWYQTFERTNYENVILDTHPELKGQTLIESERGSSYSTNDSDYDKLNPAATQAYIDAYYGGFVTNLADHLATTLVGFWEDETSIQGGAAGQRAWSPVFEDAFEAIKGYHLGLDTPTLLEHVFHGTTPQARRTRTDYFDVVSELFSRRQRQLNDWLVTRGMQLIYQPFADGGRQSEDRNYQGSPFRSWTGASIPGADMLRNDDDQGGVGSDAYGVIMKQTSSAAHLLGVAEAQHEPFGHSKQSIKQMRYYTDRMFVRGITLIQPAFYVQPGPDELAREAATNDLFVRNVQWGEQRDWARYSARLRTMLSGATPVLTTLLLYPSVSAWAADPEATDDVALTNVYQHTATALLDGHFGYDIGWEEALAGAATSGGKITRGANSYDTVILPRLSALNDSTATLLDSFVRGGGRLVAIGSIPSLSAQGTDSTVTTAMNNIFGTSSVAPGATSHAYGTGTGWTVGVDLGSSTDFREETQSRYALVWQALGAPDVTLAPERKNHTAGIFSSTGSTNTFQDHTANEVLHARRGTQDVYFVANYPDGHERFVTDANTTPLSASPLDTVMTVPVTAGVPQIWNPETGSVADAVAWWRVPGGTAVELQLPPQGGRGVVFRTGADGCHVTRAGTGVTSVSATRVEAHWDAQTRSDTIPFRCDTTDLNVTLANSITLAPITVTGPWDFRFSTWRGASSDIPMERRGAGSWTHTRPGVTGTGTYSTIIDLLGTSGGLHLPSDYFDPSVRLHLDLGRVEESANVSINSTPLGRRAWPPYAFDVTNAVHSGTNSIQMAVTNGMANSSPGFQYSPLKDSGLMTEPVLRAQVVVSADFSPGKPAKPIKNPKDR